MTKIIINWLELNLNKQLPKSFLQKDYTWQEYVPVSIIREIVRQLWILREVRYSEVKTIASDNNNITLQVNCVVVVELNWQKQELEGIGVVVVSKRAILKEQSAFGIVSKLRARAFKDALKYVAKIFEYPQDEEAIDDSQLENKTISEWEGLASIYRAILEDKKPKTKEELEQITKEFKEQFKEQIKKLSSKEQSELAKIKLLYLKKLEKWQS